MQKRSHNSVSAKNSQGGDFAWTTKKGLHEQNIGAGSESLGFESTRTQILLELDCGSANPSQESRSSGRRNWETPPSWKRSTLHLSICSIVGSLSVRRRMSSKIKKTDFPD